MSDPFIAEIRMFAGNFAPRGWAFCNGQILPIVQNTALFSLLGTTYGGDGRSTFALPNLQGRAPLHPGQGPGLTSRLLGETGGSTSVTLTIDQMPAHRHSAQVTAQQATDTTPHTDELVLPAFAGFKAYGSPRDMLNLPDQSGGDQPHNNLQPYLAVNFIIALQGIFPPRG